MKNALPTPAVLINRGILEKNIHYMAEKAKQYKVDLRPHIKTHKSNNIARMQLAAGAVGLTCAKITEAEVMVASGADDVFMAYPIIGDFQLRKAMDLARKCHLTLSFDSVYGARKIDGVARKNDLVIDVSMIINTGGNRDGVTPSEAFELGKQVASFPGINLKGIMTHEGHLYSCQTAKEVTELANKAAKEMVQVAKDLRSAGFDIQTVSTGCTLACLTEVDVPGITEWRPGTYVLNDCQENYFFTNEEDCALTILATVVGNPAKNRFIIDAGSKVLSDAKHHAFGHGLVRGSEGVIVERVSEEHGVIITDKASFPIGSQVEIIPIHVCPVVNLSNHFHLVDQYGKTECWPVDARGMVV